MATHIGTWRRSVLAVGFAGWSALVALAQPSGPTLQVNPNAGPAGIPVELTGFGFEAGTCRVAIYLDAIAGAPIAHAAVSANGFFSTNGAIPAGTSAGPHVLLAEGLEAGPLACDVRTGEVAQASFRVIEVPAATPLIQVPVGEVTPGTELVITGTGFCPSPPCSPVTILFGGLPGVHDVPVGPSGAFVANTQIPGGAPLGHALIVAMQTNEAGEIVQAFGEVDLQVRPNVGPLVRAGKMAPWAPIEPAPELERPVEGPGDPRSLPPSAVTDVGHNPNPAEPRFGGRCLGISVSPTNISNAFVASELGGIWRTTDGGGTWSHIDDVPLTIARDVMYDPQDANILIATGRYDCTVANNGGIWRSTDGGASWSKPATSNPTCNNSETSAWGISIPNDPVAHVNIYVATDCGLAISNDSGASWTHVDPCRAVDAAFCNSASPFFDVEARVVGGNIQVDVCGNEGFFRSTDGGTTWSAPDPASPLLPPAINPCHIATAPQDPNTVYLANWSMSTPAGFCQGRLMESTSGGAAGTWVDMLSGSQNCRDAWVVTHPALGGAANEFEVYYGDSVTMTGQTCDINNTPRCQTGAANWPARDSGAHSDPSDIAFDTSVANGCPILASNDGGMAMSNDCGATWTDANSGLRALDIRGGMAGTVNGATTDIYIGTQDNGMYMTLDNAATWSRPAGADVYNVEADHNPPARVFYRQCFGCNNNIADPGIVGVAGFTDPPGTVGTFAVITQFGPQSYAMLTNDGGSPALWTVYVTTDEGGTWNQMGPATLPGGPGEIQASGPAGSPTFYMRLNVGGQRRIYRLSGPFDNTATLTWISTALNFPAAWDVDPNDPNFLYVNDIGVGQIRFTTDGGVQWQTDAEATALVTQGGIYKFNSSIGALVTAIEFDENTPTIMIGTRTAGVYASINGGGSWVFVPGSIPLPLMRDFFFDESDGSIYAATRGRGVWRIGLPEADLRIEKTDSPDPVAGGAANGALTYTITVFNDGPDLAHEVTVVDTLPPDVVHTGDTAGCVPGPGALLTCNLGDIDDGDSVSFDVFVEVSSCEDSIENTATASSLDPDPDDDNNTTTETTQVIDITPPEVVACNAVGGLVDENCEFTVTFTAVVTDDCCVNAADVDVLVELTTGNATLGVPVINRVQTNEARVDVNGSVVVSALTSCPATVRVTVNADDCSDNSADPPCVATADVNDLIPPEVFCPAPLFLGRGPNAVCPMTPQQWLDSFTATDNCDPDPTLTNNSEEQSAHCCIFPCDGLTEVTFTAEDDCGNTNSCESTIFSDPNHPGWNKSDVLLPLTSNQPTYWSGNNGQPAGVSAFDILDPGCLRGRVDPECGGFRTMRGFIVAWAVNNLGQEVRWNHLKGDVVVVNYDEGFAWEYTAYAFRVVEAAGFAHGAALGSGGNLALNGALYTNGPDLLLLDFYAAGMTGFSGYTPVTIFSELTLMPLDIDLRQETGGPVTTKASFTVWNQNEVKLTNMDRCVTCWDQLLYENYGVPNQFLLANLQTDKGKAQIDGLASQLCDIDYEPGNGALGSDPRDRVSQASALVGVSTKYLDFDGLRQDATAVNLTVLGSQPALIRADVPGGPPPERPVGEVSGTLPTKPLSEATAGTGATANPVTAAPIDERLSASEKGSLLVFPVIEIRWDSEGNVLQDTFIDLTNDYPGDVKVKLYFVNGDPPLP